VVPARPAAGRRTPEAGPTEHPSKDREHALSGKQHKREIKRRKQEQRAAAARAERQRTIFTVIVIGVVMAMGAVLVLVSLDDDDRAVADAPTQVPTADAVDAEPCVPAAAPDTAGAVKPTFDAAPAEVLEEGTDYRAVVETSCGRVVVDLLEEATPQAVANFVFLAREGFYDGLQIFRNVPSIFALQTGAGDNDATWQIGYAFDDELSVAQEEGYTPGSVAMANSGPNTNGSQFFFVYGQSPLPPDYTKFGQVVEGLDVLETIGAIPVEGETPTEDVYMESVTIVTGDDVAPSETAATDAAATDAAPTDAAPAETATD